MRWDLEGTASVGGWRRCRRGLEGCWVVVGVETAGVLVAAAAAAAARRWSSSSSRSEERSSMRVGLRRSIDVEWVGPSPCVGGMERMAFLWFRFETPSGDK
ncbi:hypothetical protein ABZP36_031297 [Zizania latifolia]